MKTHAYLSVEAHARECPRLNNGKDKQVCNACFLYAYKETYNDWTYLMECDLEKLKTNRNEERKEILEKLYAIDNIYSGVCRENKEFYVNIKENLLWLKEKLKLEQLLCQDNYHTKIPGTTIIGVPANGFLTKRQVNCMDVVFHKLHTGEVQAAYHELCDFIQNYNQSKELPPTNLEKVILYLVINEIIYHIDITL